MLVQLSCSNTIFHRYASTVYAHLTMGNRDLEAFSHGEDVRVTLIESDTPTHKSSAVSLQYFLATLSVTAALITWALFWMRPVMSDQTCTARLNVYCMLSRQVGRRSRVRLSQLMLIDTFSSYGRSYRIHELLLPKRCLFQKRV